MKHSIRALLMIGVVFMAGCGGEEHEAFSRYPSLSIPEYKTADYIRDLSSSNPEMVYNAICRLAPNAVGFSNALWGPDADPESRDYKEARHVYDCVCAQLQSEEPIMVAVSLHFLQKFARSKPTRSVLIEPVCAIRSSIPMIQFEQVKLLCVLVDEDSELPESLLQRLLKSESMIVSGAAYELLGMLSDERWHAELLKRYRAADNEIEQLLLLAAYARKSKPEDAEFFGQEMLSTENPKIHSFAFGVIMRHFESSDVQSWMLDHFYEFSSVEQAEIFDKAFEVEDVEAGCELARVILSRGYDPGDECLEEMANGIEFLRYAVADEAGEEEQEELAECLEQIAKVEEMLLSFPELAARMEPMREAARRKTSKLVVMQAEYEPLQQEFSDKMMAFLSKYEIPESEQKKFLEAIPELSKLESVQGMLP